MCVRVCACCLRVGLCLQKACDSLEFRQLCTGTGIPMTVPFYTPALGGAEEAKVCQEQRDFIPAGLPPQCIVSCTLNRPWWAAGSLVICSIGSTRTRRPWSEPRPSDDKGSSCHGGPHRSTRRQERQRSPAHSGHRTQEQRNTEDNGLERA